MGDLVTLVEELSNATCAVVNSLQLPALIDERIHFGAKYVGQVSAPPYMVVVPLGGTYGGPVATTSPTGKVEQLRQRARPLWSENTELQVHIWAASTPSSPEGDFRMAQTYAYAFLVAAHRLATTQIKPERFDWVSQRDTSEQREGLGEYVILTVTVLGSAADLPVNIAAPGVKLVPTGFPGYSGKPPTQ